MDYEIKMMTLAERIDCNDLAIEFDKISGTITTKNIFLQRIKYLRYGLKSLNGVELTEQNRDTEINKLTNNEIEQISDAIALETNFSKKK